ncbi:dnaJ homolog subfamily C member 28 [Aphidius gifuensis]|uniref:dnaJ homolog subfamily C member 28 n=1 Tax=Aphidius gifuensis TaxID=684658 RepID=UPI001CDB6C23|nr:dnaJ homolog subfamily C member 28 [Aphidius gifuensis]
MITFNFNCYCSGKLNSLKCYYRLWQIIRLKHSSSSIKKSYEVLGLEENCDDEALRISFVHMAKQYHPDSCSSSASATKFSEIEKAYREIQKNRNARREKSNHQLNNEDPDIKHTAPQHRQYLVHDTGVGTPSQRQKRHTTQRAQKAVDNIMEHRLKSIQANENNTLIEKDKIRARDIKTKYGIDRLVEDYIQEAMQRGEFRDLPGAGKPLKDRTSSQSPYVDFVTYKLNEILIDNGFTPEWIQLSKEIREEIKQLEENLYDARTNFGSLPFSSEDEASWKIILKSTEPLINQINKKINKYNLLVPIIQKQMIQINLKNLEDNILTRPIGKKNNKTSEHLKNIKINDNNSNNEIPRLFDFVFSIFEKKKS